MIAFTVLLKLDMSKDIKEMHLMLLCKNNIAEFIEGNLKQYSMIGLCKFINHFQCSVLTNQCKLPYL